MQKVLTGTALGVVLFAAGVVGCDSLSQAAKILEKRVKVHTPQTTKKAPTTDSLNPTTLELSVYQQINQYRASRNLPPLRLDSRISQQARTHSQNMASGRVPFGHQGFLPRARAIGLVIDYVGIAENVAYNQGYGNPAQQAVAGWLKSPGHLANIAGSYELTGIGVAKNASDKYYFTQIFVHQ